MAQAKHIHQRTEQDVQADIFRSWKRWKFIKKNGANDPFHTDGENMNIVRNHIIHHSRELDEIRKTPMQLNMFGQELPMAQTKIPPLVPKSFMAKEKQIRKDAESLRQRFSDGTVHPAIKNKQAWMETALKLDDLLEMRRCVESCHQIMKGG